MEEIIRTKDKIEDEIYVQYIFGLDIFAVNRVRTNLDLNLLFLKFVAQKALVSAQTGMLLDFADTPEEMFGSSKADPCYDQVSVGISRGSFYLSDAWPSFPPCFFPKVTESFWQLAELPSSNFKWDEVLDRDALAFYVDPYNPNYLSKISSVFSDFMPGTNEDKLAVDVNSPWISKVLEIYRLIIVSLGDMNYFKVFSKDPTNFEILFQSRKAIEEVVLADRWYIENKDKLFWDGSKSMCLKKIEF